MRHSGVLPGRIGNATAIKDIGNLHGHMRARRRGAGLAIGPARRSWRPYWTPRGWEPAGPRASLRSSEYGPRSGDMRCRIPYDRLELVSSGAEFIRTNDYRADR